MFLQLFFESLYIHILFFSVKQLSKEHASKSSSGEESKQQVTKRKFINAPKTYSVKKQKIEQNCDKNASGIDTAVLNSRKKKIISN